EKHFDLTLKDQKWALAIPSLERLVLQEDTNETFEHSFKLAMLYQINGKSDKAIQLYNKLYDLDLVKNDEQGYRKIIIYDNGESRIEFYKKTHPTDQVMLTFDSIYMAWN